jgi:hypothetical protein
MVISPFGLKKSPAKALGVKVFSALVVDHTLAY